MEHGGGDFDDIMGKLEILAMEELGPPPPRYIGEIGGPRPRILFKWFNAAPLHSSKLYGPQILRNLDVM